MHGNLYGTSRAELERAHAARGIIFDIDHQGARQIKCALPDVVTVFILPPSMDALRARLRGRASEDEATVERRFRVASDEIAHYGMFDYVLVNDQLETAIEQLVSIFRAEECQRQRAAPACRTPARGGPYARRSGCRARHKRGTAGPMMRTLGVIGGSGIYDVPGLSAGGRAFGRHALRTAE